MTMHALSYAAALTAIIWFYVDTGQGWWNTLCRPGAHNEDAILLELARSASHVGCWKRRRALLMYGAFVAFWPAWITVGWMVARLIRS